MNELIVRIAARGDGVTTSGRHVPFGVPGDAVLDDGALAFGAHHQVPPCRHFPECGGCQLQHADDDAYRDYLVSRIETALDQHGLGTEIREPHLSPPQWLLQLNGEPLLCATHSSIADSWKRARPLA